MPFIEEDDLVKLYDELDKLSTKEEELRRGFIDLKLKSIKARSRQRIKNIVIAILVLGSVLLLFFAWKASKEKLKLLQLNKRIETKMDSIQHLVVLQEEHQHELTPTYDLVYVVQIGAFENFDIDLSEDHKKILQKRENKDGLHIYTIGEFEKLQQAKVFNEKIHKLGFTDAFIVAYYKGKHIDLDQAISIQNNQ